MALWCHHRKRFVSKGIPIEEKRIEDWKQKAKLFSESQIDWKNRETSEVEIKQPKGKYKEVLNAGWVYKDGSPERVIRKPSIPKSFEYSPESFSKGERKFYSQSLQVKPNYITSHHIGKFPGKFGSRPNVFRYPTEECVDYFLNRGVTTCEALPNPKLFTG